MITDVEEVRIILNNHLNTNNFSSNQVLDMCNTIKDYSRSKKISSKMINNELSSAIDFLTKLGLTNDEILTAIGTSPYIIATNKKDLLAKYLILSILVDPKTNKSIRKELLINYPKYYILGIHTLYSRFKYLTEKSLPITKWHLLKMTNTEFLNRFSLTQKELMKMYPYDDSKIKELFNLPGNEELKEVFKVGVI